MGSQSSPTTRRGPSETSGGHQAILPLLSKATILKQHTQPRYCFKSLLLCIPLYNSHLYFFIKHLDGKNFFRFFPLTYYKKVMSKHLLLKKKKKKPTKNPNQARLSCCTHSGEAHKKNMQGGYPRRAGAGVPLGGCPRVCTAERLQVWPAQLPCPTGHCPRGSSSCVFDPCSFNSALLIDRCFISLKNKTHVAAAAKSLQLCPTHTR